MSIITKFEQFTLRVREKGNKNEYLNMNDIAGFNLLDELSIYIKKNVYLFKIDEEAERTYRIEKNEYKDNSLYCRIKVGKFGESSELIDTLSGSGVFHKERVHSDTIPLFFHLKADPKSSTAILNIQRINNRTLLPEIRTIIESVLENLRKDQFVYEIKPLKKNTTLNDFIKNNNGQINSLQLHLDTNSGFENLEPISLTFKSKSRKPFPEEIKKLLLKTKGSKGLENLKNIIPETFGSFNITGATAEVKSPITGKMKIEIGQNIDLPNSFNINYSKDQSDKNGHPTYESLKLLSNSYFK